jgi:methylphosphotriester-DNA--protein-cysteine methyltransferase
VVISFATGAYLTPFRGAPFVGGYIMLRMPDADHFTLAGHTFPLPTFQNAEKLIDQMVEQGLLASDEVVARAMRGTPKATSTRSVQRHFKEVAGLSPKKLADIRRAQEAVRMLKNGKDPSATAVDAGYYDQPHLTKELKRLMDSSPKNVDDVTQV